MSQLAPRQQGFSTVELLISLFIAAAFIATGFQLFSIVTKDSNEARLRSVAASVVSQTIQERMNTVAKPCGPTPASSTGNAIPTSKLPQATFDVTYSCPYGTSSATTRINVVVKYGSDSPQKSVGGSLDVTR